MAVMTDCYEDCLVLLILSGGSNHYHYFQVQRFDLKVDYFAID